MHCTCRIQVGDGDDFVELLRDAVITARKKHQCSECHRVIKPGEQYRMEVWVFECLGETHKTCMDCHSIRDNLFGDMIYGQIIQDLEDYIEESDGGIPEKCIAKLTPAARDRVCELIERCWVYDREVA